MNTKITENEPLTLDYCYYWRIKNINGALIRDGMKGEIQHVNNEFFYCENNIAIKQLKTKKDLNDIIIPIANL